MTDRRRPTLAQQVKALTRAAKCPSCGLPLANGLEWDHAHALALGGTNEDDNWMPLCIECHSRKTNGTKATSAGSDKNRIAKVERINKKRAGIGRTKRKIPSRSFPKRKVKS